MNQKFLKKIINFDEIILICGRYEGIDQRFINKYVDELLLNNKDLELIVVFQNDNTVAKDIIIKKLNWVITPQSLPSPNSSVCPGQSFYGAPSDSINVEVLAWSRFLHIPCFWEWGPHHIVMIHDSLLLKDQLPLSG